MGQRMDRDAAVVESLRDNTWPVFLTTATTVIGFLSLNFSASPPFRVLGNLVAFGMLAAYVYSMTLLPALLLVLPLRARPVGAGDSTFSIAGAPSSWRAAGSCCGRWPRWQLP